MLDGGSDADSIGGLRSSFMEDLDVLGGNYRLLVESFPTLLKLEDL